MRKRYQEGGLVEETDDSGLGGLGGYGGQVDPSMLMMMTLMGGGFATPESHERANAILDDVLAKMKAGQEAESTAITKKKQQAEAVRQTLRDAQAKLRAQEFNRGDALLAVSQALGSPTKTGSFGEMMSNVAGSLREPIARRKEFERERDNSLSALDLQIAQADSDVTESEFELEKLQRTLDSRMGIEALQTLRRPTQGKTNPLGQIIPAAAQARDREYLKQYTPFVTGGSAQAARGIATLKFARELLTSGRDALTGPYIGAVAQTPYVGRWLQAFVSPTGADVRDLIEQTIQNDLRPTLGSQFTEREGERLISRTYNPALEEKRNARRLDSLIQQLERTYTEKSNMAKYFEENNGTLFNYKGPIKFSATADDFDIPEENEELSDDAKRSLLPGSRLYAPGDPRPNARGGPIRYQDGGRVRYQDGGEAELGLAELQDDAANLQLQGSEGIEAITQLWNQLGYAPDALDGALVGLGAEQLLKTLQRRVRALGGVERGERRVIDSMVVGGQSPVGQAEEIKRGRRAGVPSQLIDLDSPSTRVLTEEALAYGGDSADEALNALRERVEGSRERVNQDINRGLKPDAYQELEDKLVGRSSIEAQRNIFQPVYDKYPGIPQDEVLTQIIETPEGQKALDWAMEFYQNTPGKKIGKEDITGMVRKPSLEFYDYVRKGLDIAIAKEKNPEMEAVIRDLRKTYVDRLDALAPKDYKEARLQYAGDLEIRDALKAGTNFQRMRPERLEQMASTMGFHEKNAFRAGMAQSLYDTLNNPSGEGYQAAQKIVGSPATMERLRPFFDSAKEFKLFETAVSKEAELFRLGRDTLRRGDNARLERERVRQTPGKYVAQRASGLRYAVSPIGFLMRIYRDFPKMNEKKADEVLDVLQRGDPAEMDSFITNARKLARLRGVRGARRGAAAGLGALGGMAYKWLTGDEEVQE